MPITDVVRLTCDRCRDTVEEVPGTISIEELQGAIEAQGWQLDNLLGPIDRWTAVCRACQEPDAWV